MAGACRGGTCGRRQHPRPGRKGRLSAARPQGAAPRPGLPPARAVAGRSDRQQGQRPRKVTPPAREVPLKGSSACRKGGCPCRWRATLLSA
ncbi:hypothetical protein GW17_00060240 [Ensete ventricosum]|nr:hypothetical protein GW17_00060240 [Ensete ventricosum]RZS27816.1 hypothetical protein BHM03_00061342 [Ensete ventricosum]